MRQITSFLCFILLSILGYSQSYTISGIIEDASSGEKLIGANIYDESTYRGTITNFYGFYSLTLPGGKIKLTVSYVGYGKYQKDIVLNRDTAINISILSTIELREVTVTGNSVRSIIESSQMSAIQVPVITAKALPVLLGEVDILKTIQLMPGVQSGNEGTSGIYVRGGGPDQNLFLLDGVPVYNVNHLFGFFSVFNADAINSVTLLKGGFPARYGGRLSSVVDIRMKEGNNKKIKGEGSIGLISSKLTLEGPVRNENTSFIISGRRTYIDLLARPIIKLFDDNVTAGYYFYDLNAKINHKINDKNRIYLSAYMGNDKAYTKYTDEYQYDGEKHTIDEDAALQWGNITTALRWNSIINKKLFSNTTLTYSRYRFSIGTDYSETITTANLERSTAHSSEYYSGITDVAAKIDFDYLPNPDHSVKFGLNNTYHTFKPGINVLKNDSDDENEKTDTTFGNKNIYANELSLYVEDDIKIGNRFKINLGVHYSNFDVKSSNYHSLQPRISSRFLVNKKTSLKASYTQMYQNIHLLTNTTIGMPTDLWLPVTDKIKPLQAHQYAVGGAYNMNDLLAISIEGFYKTMNNLIEYKEGASFFSAKDDWEEQVEIGKGWSYGGELLLQKDIGDFKGWIGYTLAWNFRQFENIGFGEKYPYKYDRRNDIGIALAYKLSERTDFGITWVYGTGNATTLAQEKYVSLFSINQSSYDYNINNTLEYYDNRNGYRMASYHRLDIGVNRHKKKSWGETSWSFGIYNVYNRQNPFYLYFGYKDDMYDPYGNSKKVLKQVSLFPIIPSFRWNFKF